MRLEKLVDFPKLDLQRSRRRSLVALVPHSAEVPCAACSYIFILSLMHYGFVVVVICCYCGLECLGCLRSFCCRLMKHGKDFDKRQEIETIKLNPGIRRLCLETDTKFGLSGPGRNRLKPSKHTCMVIFHDLVKMALEYVRHHDATTAKN